MSKRMSRRSFLSACSGGAVLMGGAAVLDGARRALPSLPGLQAPAPIGGGSGAAPLTITYWSGLKGNLAQAEQALIRAFHASQSEVRVRYQPQAGYSAAAQRLAERGAPQADLALLPDTAWLPLHQAGALAPLDQLAAEARLPLGDMQPGLLNESLRGGSRFWLPFARSTPLFYYNQDAWEAAGLPQRGPQSWQELEEWAPRLSGGGRAAFGHPRDPAALSWLFQAVIWQFGGAYSTPDLRLRLEEPHSLRAAQFYQDSVRGAGWARVSGDLDQAFLGGRVASLLGSSNSIARYSQGARFRVGVAALPRETFAATLTGGAGLAIPAGRPAEHQRAAMRYAAFATSPEAALVWAQATGGLPLRISALDTPRMQGLLAARPGMRTALQQVPLARPQDAARVAVPGGERLIGAGILRILEGGEPAAVWREVGAQLHQAAGS
jgi:sn-glycerol 3-phosphate transport system substrate-binding protein